MAVGRISGPLLKANLLRQGVDLAFETDLLYLDVNNGRIGVKTASPTHDLTVNGTINTQYIDTTTQANIATFTISGDTIASSSSTINLNPAGGSGVVYQGRLLVNNNLQLTTNAISTTTPNSNLEISTTGTGEVNVNSNLWVNGNIHATGNITADGNITIGSDSNDNVTFNADIASNIIPDQNNTYDLGSNPSTGGKAWKVAYINDVMASTMTVGSIITAGVDLTLPQGNIYYVATTGSDTNAGNHEHSPVLTIKKAFTLATSGDTVYIYPGVYQEIFPLTIPAGVTVRGAGLRSVKITPTTATRYNDAFLINGDVTVEDITVADYFSGGNYFTVTAASAGSTTVNVGTAPFDHTYVSGGTITIGATSYPITNAVYTYTTGVLVLTHTGGTATLGQSVFVSNLTFSCNGSTRIFPDNGYAFRFANDFTVTSRSPYIRNCTVITKGSVTSPTDPLGFASGDAGKGAYIDGAYATAVSKEASLLFHSVTFITPGVDCITAKNGVRIEWLNSFTYYANRGIYAFASNYGFAQQGLTRLRIDTRLGTWNIGDTLTYYDTDGVTVIASGVIAGVDGNYVNLTGRCLGFQTITDRTGKTVYANGDAKLSTAQKKFGTASLALDGTGDYASCASQPDFSYGTGNFCIELWVQLNSTATQQVLVDQRTAGVDVAAYLDVAAGGAVRFYLNGAFRITTTATLSINTWYHIALSRSGTSTKLFINGTQSGVTYTDTSNYLEKPIRIGANYTAANGVNGYIDDVRITKGLARYTSNFVAPTTAFTGDLNTVLLLHFDGANNSTTFIDDGITLQDLRTSAGGTATLINFADYSDFGAEIRSIGSANIYGNYGVVGDGQGVIAYLISQNFAYIGAGKKSTNDPNDRIAANEVVETNLARIYYTSVDNEGNFSVGDNFYVNQKTGEVLFNNQALNITSSSGVTFTDGTNTTIVTATNIDTGNLRISGNTVESITGDVNVTAASGSINLQNNTYVTGNLDVTGDVNIGGNIQIGDQTTDSINFVGGISSNLVPAVTGTYDIGTSLLRWQNLYLSGAFNTTGNITATGNISSNDYLQLADVRISGNTVQTTTTNTDLELLANGTGNVVVEGIKVDSNNIQSVATNSNITLTPQGTGSVIVNSNQSLKVPVGTTLERPASPTNGMIRYNTDIQSYEGYNNGLWLRLSGVSDADNNTYITAESTPGANDNVIRFYANGSLMVTIDSTKLFAERFQTDNLDIENNTISSKLSNTDINLTTSGTGGVRVGNLRFRNNTVTNVTSNAITEFTQTNDGYVKIAGTNGVVIPSGDTLNDRPLVPELGMIRFNTAEQLVEVYNGVVWTSVAGTSGGVTAAEAQDLGILSAIIFG